MTIEAAVYRTEIIFLERLLGFVFVLLLFFSDLGSSASFPEALNKNIPPGWPCVPSPSAPAPCPGKL